MESSNPADDTKKLFTTAKAAAGAAFNTVKILTILTKSLYENGEKLSGTILRRVTYQNMKAAGLRTQSEALPRLNRDIDGVQTITTNFGKVVTPDTKSNFENSNKRAKTAIQKAVLTANKKESFISELLNFIKEQKTLVEDMLAKSEEQLNNKENLALLNERGKILNSMESKLNLIKKESLEIHLELSSTGKEALATIKSIINAMPANKKPDINLKADFEQPTPE